ncbi:hypothetical protein STEG23_035821, partial [Scotinomys teguina]
MKSAKQQLTGSDQQCKSITDIIPIASGLYSSQKSIKTKPSKTKSIGSGRQVVRNGALHWSEPQGKLTYSAGKMKHVKPPAYTCVDEGDNRHEKQRNTSKSKPKGTIHFILLFSRQGKLRLQKWYTTLPDKERKKITREIIQTVLSRGHRTSSFIDWKELKLVYKRYASLYFCCAIENQDNELLTLEVVHRYVELLDKYFGNVCELDIIFNFEKAYFILDEFIIGGEIQETSKRTAVKAIEDSDMLQE